jgi:hypothetical protein
MPAPPAGSASLFLSLSAFLVGPVSRDGGAFAKDRECADTLRWKANLVPNLTISALRNCKYRFRAGSCAPQVVFCDESEA